MNQEEIFKLQKKLKTKLSDKRYLHTLGVAYTASALAMRYEYDQEKALVAGLLHDCAKYMSGDEMYKLSQKYKIEITETETQKPDLLHAKLGSYYAKKKYNVTDEDILTAIKWHTTGRPNMTLLDKIIYIADYIEPGRDKMPRLSDVRKQAFIDIDECLKMILSDSVDYLKSSDMVIDDSTLKTYEYYMNN